MRVLIFAFLALTASATHYSYSSYPSYSYSSSPSYSSGYGSSLYGASYGSGLGYGSGIGYGSSSGYGSGIGYGSSSGYGSGIGYGSSIGYGVGGGQSYTAAVSPVVYQTASYSGGQPYDDGPIYTSGYSDDAVPERIAFTLGGTGYQTGPSVASGVEKWRSSAVSKPAGVFRQVTTTVHRSGVQGLTTGEAPGRVSFKQDFPRVSGQPGLQRSRGTTGVASSRKTITPITVRTERHPTAVAGDIGSSIKSGTHGTDAMSGIHLQEIAGIGGHGSGAGFTGSGFNKFSSPVAPPLPRPSTVASGGFSAVHKSRVHAVKTTPVQPQGFIFTQDFSEVPEHSGVHPIKPEIHAYERTGTPVGTVVAPKPAYGAGTVHRSGSQGVRATSGPSHFSFTQDFSKVRGQSGITAIKPEVQTFRKVVTPVRTAVASKIPTGSIHASRTVLRSSAQDVRRTGGYSQGGFTQDFSKVISHSGVTAVRPEIHSYDKFPAPVRAVVPQRVPYRPYGSSGAIRRSGFLGSTGGQPQISFIQDFSKTSGQPKQFGVKPEILSFDKVSVPVVGTVAHRPSAPHGAGYLQKTGAHGITGIREQGEITFAQDIAGVSGHSGFHGAAVKPAVVSFDRFATRGVSALPRPPSGSRIEALPKRTPQSFSAAGPSRISFTQDFSRVAGHQTSRNKPVVSTHNKVTVPDFPGVIPSQVNQAPRRNTFTLTPVVAPKPAQTPITENLVFKAPKEPVVQQPTLTTIYDQTPVQRVSVDHAEDKSIFATGPVTDFVRDHAVGYKQEITTVRGHGGDKVSNILYIPGTGSVQDKSSAYKHSAVAAGAVAGRIGGQSDLGNVVSSYKVSSVGHTGDKANIFVAVPVDGYDGDKSSALLHSSGIAPAGGFLDDKGAVYQLNAGNTDSSLSRQGQAGYSDITTPFKSYYSSSYPGYSHASGESPRFDFSPDRNLLYTYSSPYLVSPFSYAYSSGKHHDQVYKKA